MTSIAPRGAGSLRERRPGVWEIRVSAGWDPCTGHTVQRSVSFHGTAEQAEAYRRVVAMEYAGAGQVARAGPLLSVGELLQFWLAAEHAWRPSTAVGYASTVRGLRADAAWTGAG